MEQLETQILQGARERAAHAVFRSKSFRTNFTDGFAMAVHQKHPHAPRSPFYFNLRGEEIKEGTLTGNDYSHLAGAMVLYADTYKLWDIGRPITTIPDAGTPLLDFMMVLWDVLPLQQFEVGRFTLIKEMIDGKRHFHLKGDEVVTHQYMNTLMIDDLVTSAVTKQLATQPIITAGGSVTDLLVFLNRSATARDELKKLGITLHAVWEFEHLMEWALGQGYLKRHEYERIIEYPHKLARYLRLVGAA